MTGRQSLRPESSDARPLEDMSTESTSITGPRQGWSLAIALVLVAVAIIGLLVGTVEFAWLLSPFTNALGPMWQILKSINPTAFLLIVAVLALERLFPAKPTQRLISVGFAQDVIWYFLSNLGKLFVIAYWIAFLRTAIFDQYLWFLRVESAETWPEWVKFVVGLLGLDFIGWFHHWIRHQYAWLWYFHAIHHSQREMNLFTDFRVHVVEHLVAWSIKFIPAMALGLSNPEIFYLAIIFAWHSHLYHANVKSNFGPLRYILVTPQSHRIHHSREIRHFDKNYGVIFSIWDHMFGTQYHNYDEYPETGIDDEMFPHPQAYWDIPKTLLLQTIYPFRKIYASICTARGGGNHDQAG